MSKQKDAVKSLIKPLSWHHSRETDADKFDSRAEAIGYVWRVRRNCYLADGVTIVERMGRTTDWELATRKTLSLEEGMAVAQADLEKCILNVMYEKP